MEYLPLSRSDYNKALLIADFISKLKKELNSSASVTDIVFKPKPEGYEISFKENGNKVRLTLKTSRSIFRKYRLKVNVFFGDELKSSFRSDNSEASITKIKSLLR